MSSVDPFSSVQQIAGSLGAASVAGSAESKKKTSRKDKVELSSRYAGLLERAMQMEEYQPELIWQAQELVMSGRADSMEAALEAARRILQYGV
ncbi:MAG TPA: hypothetical protein PLP49_04740 [Anaerohalosphaeraceae bacterium]|nr:hypothetical protein [Anaerohalosphaeraceae bacterium]HPB92590.1 hypothetical protein [Anaerohalosphaeraceae bacterium]HRT23670.1 hypothetical protein [Anaerohalosphaeraceae bacterium]